MAYETEQERFWAGSFGNAYIDRNNYEQKLHAKAAIWAKMLRSARGTASIRELGCNIGLNLVALKRLNPNFQLSGYEINETAAKHAAEFGVADIQQASILDRISEPAVDLTFTSGVLIHINPDYLDKVYDNLVSGSRRYVLVAEYYNPVPTQISYRGHEDRLYKRDFAGDLMESYGLNLVDYGFFYHRDHLTPQDDMSWFLLEK